MSTAFAGSAKGTDAMGEVRTPVRLTNHIDQALHDLGYITPDEIRSCVEDALVDTGAVRTVIPRSVMESLGLQPRGQRNVEYADGHSEDVDVTGPILIEIDGRDTLDEALVVGNEVLIGQTVLEKLDFLVDCKNQRLIQNPKHPNGPANRI